MSGIHAETRRQVVRLFATGEHSCSYLPGRVARTAFADPYFPLDNRHYSLLIRRGMRRSGRYVYRPACTGCSACRSLRIPVEAFAPRRSQRRCAALNADLETRLCPPVFRQEHFDLYARYVGSRHAGGGMDNPDPESYMDFLVAPWSDTQFVEFRQQGTLLAVAVMDRVADGLSAVYTFFDPDHTRRGLGTNAILWQIAETSSRRLNYLYLGYWIQECPKMRYKEHFQPAEVFNGGAWRPLGLATD